MQGESRFRIFNPDGIHKPMGYSHVAEVNAGKLVYISGQVALDIKTTNTRRFIEIVELTGGRR